MRFTFDGNPAAERVIQIHQSLVAATVSEVVPPSQLAAIVMIGGYGRDEGAYIIDEAGQPHPYNDYDYFVVFKNTSRKQAWDYIRKIPDLEHETGIDVDFFPLLASELPNLELSLMNAEMRAGHAVIWGDVNILDAMPEMPLAEVPSEEFLRLLTNRGCLLLMNRLNPEREDYSKFINKAWLAIGDAALAAADAYALSYIEKRGIAEQVLTDPLLIACYQRAIDIRMRPDLYQPWTESDMPQVLSAWHKAVEALDSPARGIAFNFRTLKTAAINIVRHLKDHRLPLADVQIVDHPRLRIRHKLTKLLRLEKSESLQHQGSDLLQLWGRYS